jgi:integrase
MLMRMRYITRRVSPNGKERWYWQRRGYKLTRLPDDPSERFVAQERLNRRADSHATSGVAPHGSIGWLIRQYCESDRFKDLRPGTKKYYSRFLRDIEALGRGELFADWTRPLIVDFIKAYPKAHQRRQVAAVIKNLVDAAMYHELIKTNPATDLRLKQTKPRDKVWTANEITQWLAAAEHEEAHMTTAFLLLQHTAQRVGDVLAMTWSRFDGGIIKLRQQKTDALIEVPCHPLLRSHLEAIQPTATTIVAFRNRPVKYLRFNERFRRISGRAGIDAQARDLRRTAMLRMAEAGATTPEIASVSGHSINSTQRILDTYLPRGRVLAQAAIAKLADRQRTQLPQFTPQSRPVVAQKPAGNKTRSRV